MIIRTYPILIFFCLHVIYYCQHKEYNEDIINRSVQQANSFFDQTQDNSKKPVKHRLAVMILFTNGFNSKSNIRLDWLHCALVKLHRHLANTSTDVFIWTKNNTLDKIQIPQWISKFPRTMVLEIPPESWKIPSGLIDNSQWVVRNKFDIDYYLMGRWRLTFSLDFVKAMGYGYHLQLDDDAILNANVDYDIVDRFKLHQYEMGVFSDVIGEVPHVVLGLPELTLFWLKVNRYTPKGLLYQHTRPKDITGLTSEGWDRMYHPGYFLIISIEFWYRPEVQSYLNTILRSGRDIEGRWQEQSVMNMMRLVFIPADKLWIMSDIDIGHDRHRKANFENWCVKTGASLITAT